MMLQAENTLFTIAVIGYFALTILNFVFVAMKKEKLAPAAFYLQAFLCCIRRRLSSGASARVAGQ